MLWLFIYFFFLCLMIVLERYPWITLFNSIQEKWNPRGWCMLWAITSQKNLQIPTANYIKGDTDSPVRWKTAKGTLESSWSQVGRHPQANLDPHWALAGERQPQVHLSMAYTDQNHRSTLVFMVLDQLKTSTGPPGTIRLRVDRHHYDEQI